MKDSVESVEPRADQQERGHRSGPMTCLRSRFIRVGLAEALCTYIMMVRCNLVPLACCYQKAMYIYFLIRKQTCQLKR